MHQNNGTLVRYLAVLLVAVQHAFALTGQPDPTGRLGVWWIGHFGVLIFFALSGYLLYPRARDDSLSTFALRRVLRIYPLFLVVLLLTVVAGAFVTTLTLSEYMAQGAAKYFYRNLFHFAQSGLPGVQFANAGGADTQVNAAIWSIYYELKAYCLYALLAALGVLAHRSAFAVLVLLVVILEPSRTTLHLADPRAYSVTLAFLFGGLIASQAWRLRPVHLLVATLAGLLALRLQASWPVAPIIMLFCIAVLAVGIAFGDVPYLKWADRLPDLTYGIFLLHWPLMLIVSREFPTDSATVLALGLLGAGLIAVPLHYCIEEPARRWRPQWRRSERLPAA